MGKYSDGRKPKKKPKKRRKKEKGVLDNFSLLGEAIKTDKNITYKKY